MSLIENCIVQFSKKAPKYLNRTEFTYIHSLTHKTRSLNKVLLDKYQGQQILIYKIYLEITQPIRTIPLINLCQLFLPDNVVVVILMHHPMTWYINKYTTHIHTYIDGFCKKMISLTINLIDIIMINCDSNAFVVLFFFFYFFFVTISI